jgi:hypothetical protein
LAPVTISDSQNPFKNVEATQWKPTDQEKEALKDTISFSEGDCAEPCMTPTP